MSVVLRSITDVDMDNFFLFLIFLLLFFCANKGHQPAAEASLMASEAAKALGKAIAASLTTSDGVKALACGRQWPGLGP